MQREAPEAEAGSLSLQFGTIAQLAASSSPSVTSGLSIIFTTISPHLGHSAPMCLSSCRRSPWTLSTSCPCPAGDVALPEGAAASRAAKRPATFALLVPTSSATCQPIGSDQPGRTNPWQNPDGLDHLA